MFTAIAVIALLSILAYLAQRNYARQPFHPRMAGSVSFEDRDASRVARDLVW